MGASLLDELSYPSPHRPSTRTDDSPTPTTPHPSLPRLFSTLNRRGPTASPLAFTPFASSVVPRITSRGTTHYLAANNLPDKYTKSPTSLAPPIPPSPGAPRTTARFTVLGHRQPCRIFRPSRLLPRRTDFRHDGDPPPTRFPWLSANPDIRGPRLHLRQPRSSDLHPTHPTAPTHAARASEQGPAPRARQPWP